MPEDVGMAPALGMGALDGDVRGSAKAGQNIFSNRYALYVVLLMALVQFFNQLDRIVFSILTPHIKADLGFTDSEIGILVGAFSIFYALCSLPIARWADRGVRRDIIALALGFWSVMTALCGLAQNFATMFAARIGVGVGEAGAVPPGQSLLCDYVPVRQRAGVFAFCSLGSLIGVTAGIMLGGWLSDLIGWRATFAALGIPGILLAVLIRFTLREPVRGTCDGIVEASTGTSFAAAIAFLWRCRTYRQLIVIAIVTGLVQYGLLQWWPSFFQRVHGLSPAVVGAYYGIAYGAGSGFGILVGGLLANQAGKRAIGRPLALAALWNALSAVGFAVALLIPSSTAAFSLVGIATFFMSVGMPPLSAALYSVAMPSMRATAGTILGLFAAALGIGVGPFAMGALSDFLAPTLGADSLRYGMLAPVPLLSIVVWSLYRASRTLEGDLKAVGSVSAQ